MSSGDNLNKYFDDPEYRKAIQIIAGKTARGGVSISISGLNSDDRSSALVTKAKALANEIQTIVNKSCVSWVEYMLVEGEIFIQAIVEAKSRKVVDAKRMPATSMKKITDDGGSFADKSMAFAQIDVVTGDEVATFPMWMIYHVRLSDHKVPSDSIVSIAKWLIDTSLITADIPPETVGYSVSLLETPVDSPLIERVV